MTPDKARRLLDGTTPGDEWYYHVKWGAVHNISPIDIIPGGDLDVTEEDAALIAAAPTLAAMIAGMHEEWGVEWDNSGDDIDPYTWGFTTRADAETWERCSRELRGERGHVVRRYVTEPEEA